MPEESLRIISLHASNVKKLKAVTITPKGNVVTLTGPNGSGKSSVLDSIWYALGGKDNICDQPVRQGASQAKTVVKIGNAAGQVQLVCTRKMSSAGTSITVNDADGRPQSSPQTLLDRLIGNLAFDPLEFVRMGDKPRVETLRKLVGLDFTAQDDERKKLYEERTFLNRDKDRFQAALNANPVPKNAPKQKVSVQALMQQLSAMLHQNEDNAQARRQLASAEAEMSVAAKALEEAKTRAAKASAQVESLRTELAGQTDTDPAPIRQQIQEAESVNAAFDRAQAAKESEAQWIKTDENAKKLTARIECIDQSKQDALAAAKFPLPNLSFDESGVIHNGLPFSQASTGEQLRVSVAVGMALNPKLRVIFIRDGSLIDDAGLALIAEMADKKDYQVWLETVHSKDPTAVVIEDGEVKEAV